MIGRGMEGRHGMPAQAVVRAFKLEAHQLGVGKAVGETPAAAVETTALPKCPQ